MRFKDFIFQSLSVTLGILIFIVLMYIALQIFTSDRFSLNSTKSEDVPEIEDDEFEDLDIDDDLTI